MTILEFCRNQPAKTNPINLNSATNNKSISKKMLYSRRILNQPTKKVTISKPPTNVTKQQKYEITPIQSNPKSIFYYDVNNKIHYTTDITTDPSAINRPQAFHVHN